MGVSQIKTQLSVDSAYGIRITQKMVDSYDAYLQNHRLAILLAWEQVKGKLDFSSEDLRLIHYLISIHDNSKFRKKEYFPFLIKYYSNIHNTESEEAYKVAWKNHYLSNPHHWRYWVVNDQGREIPYVHTLEMILNWHSKSLNDPELTASNQYEEERNSLILNDITRNKLEKIIGKFDKPIEMPVEILNSDIGYNVFENQKIIVKNKEDKEIQEDGTISPVNPDVPSINDPRVDFAVADSTFITE